MEPEASGDNAGDKVEACPSPMSKNKLFPPPQSCSLLIYFAFWEGGGSAYFLQISVLYPKTSVSLSRVKTTQVSGNNEQPAAQPEPPLSPHIPPLLLPYHWVPFIQKEKCPD